MQKKTKLLIVSESIDVNDSSASKGRVALIQNLIKAGFHVKVYHFNRKEIELTDLECVSIQEQKSTPWYLLSKLQLLIKRLTGWNANNQIEKKWGFSFAHFNDTYSIKKTLQKEDSREFDWVITLSKAASFRPHKALLGLPEWHTKWLAYIHDPYPMHFYPRPYTWVEPGYFQKQEFMRAISKTCAYGVFPSRLLQEWMGSYFPDFLERGVVIPHQWVETPNTLTEIPDYFKKNSFTVLHAGALMKQRNPIGLIEGFQLFLKKVPDARANTQLVLLGRHEYHKEVLIQKQQVIPQLYVSTGYVPFKEVQVLQDNVSVNVILEAKAEISPFLPGKFPHCVAACKPILHLGPALSETKRLLGEEYTFSAEIDDVVKISELLMTLYENWKEKKDSPKYNFKELNRYLGVDYLRETLEKLKSE
ncbi:UDP-glycosyltransferase [uncultured Planktosalinus sp.]|uniref:UDP-glycosyltransferase n=1 Tax=uncultured Planktosalinus sp. TaxID=1810935 RepID=UPI0030DC779F